MEEIVDFMTNLFGTESWLPRWHCGIWTKFHGWLYIISDFTIWFAYFIILVILVLFIQRKKNLPYPNVFWLFSAFILFCGATHLIDAVIFWWPAYRLSAFLRFFTAIISCATVIALIRLLPVALKFKTPKEYEIETQHRKKAEQEAMVALGKLKDTHFHLEKSEKMVSLGQLTAGIAHELNNPINFVGAGASALSMDITELFFILEKAEQLEKNNLNSDAVNKIKALKQKYDYDNLKENLQQTLEDLKEGANRTANIVKCLKNFSRQDEGQMELANIHDILDATLTVLQNKLKNKITVIKDYRAEIPELMCFQGKLNQVLLNIIANAEEAIDKKGTITITTKNKTNKVTIIIQDDGSGMSEEVKNQIFDPFFTTKPVGEGVGLGMSISFEIIKEHNGNIIVESELNKGTIITIDLPIKQTS